MYKIKKEGLIQVILCNEKGGMLPLLQGPLDRVRRLVCGVVPRTRSIGPCGMA
jgi:hypothetical protein